MCAHHLVGYDMYLHIYYISIIYIFISTYIQNIFAVFLYQSLYFFRRIHKPQAHDMTLSFFFCTSLERGDLSFD